MLSKALQLPVSDRKKFLIGSAMYVVPWLSLFTGLFSYGYAVQYVRRLLQTREDVLPMWADWKQLLKDGFLSTIIGLVYMLPAVLLLVLMFVGISVTGSYSTAVVAIIQVLAVIMVLVAWYIVPVAVIEFVARNRFGSAFELRRFMPVLKHKGYMHQWFTAFVFSIIVSTFVFAVLYVLNNLLAGIGGPWTVIASILGALIAGGVAFYQLMVTFNLYAHGWLDSQEQLL